MTVLRVFFACNIVLFKAFYGDSAAVNKEIKFPSAEDDIKNSLIEAQSIGRIVNRKEVNTNTVPPQNYVGDITRTTNTDKVYSCPHASSEIPQINVINEPKINESPTAQQQTEFGSYMSSQSTYSSGFQLQIQNTRPAQHIHYHYLVPNTPPKPTINYVSHSDSNAYNVNSENKHFPPIDTQPSHINANNQQYTHPEVTQANPLYSAVDNSGYLSDFPDEHQSQASENTLVYESLRNPSESYVNKIQGQQETFQKTNTEMPPKQAIQNHQMDKPEVYFITYYGQNETSSTSPPNYQKLNETSNEVFDGSGLIDIRGGKDEILDSESVVSTTPYNEHSAYNVPLN
ncbi:uncharacterized protein LOC108095989 [Drosophila ficusphila]|uniref:uncharacterized protein LOC108095989 n=1 Tax=Drosophila ficusphila TaxID=30025 RepID=UPI0007E677EF|nr:uncharacterized protein LOC108095989 [Drosophila ficusphila]